MKDIMNPGVVNERASAWAEWHTNSSTELTLLKNELNVRLDNIEFAGKYNADIHEVAKLMHAVTKLTEIQIHAIGFSAEDYQDLRTSRTFRVIMKLRDWFKK